MNSVIKIKGSKIVTHLLMIGLAIFFLLPFIIMVTTSMKKLQECYVYPITILPEKFNFNAYHKIFNIIPFGTYYKNTVFITALSILGVVLSCPLVAYSFARLKWYGRDVLFFITIAVMMIPYQLTMVPIFIIFSHLGLVGTPWPLIIPKYLGIPFYIFLLRQFFKGLPKDLDDAARIDGCTEFKIYYKIFLPLMKPAVLTIAIYELLGSWNDFNGPLIYLQLSEQYTLQIGLQQFKSMHATNWPPMMAAAVLMSLPIIIAFFFAQKQFMEGITFSGIKG